MDKAQDGSWAMSSALLLASENEKLRAENQHQKRKKAKRRMYIAKGGVLTGAEGLSRVQTARTERAEAAADVAAEQPQQYVQINRTHSTYMPYTLN
jgi:hypothetical protein